MDDLMPYKDRNLDLEDGELPPSPSFVRPRRGKKKSSKRSSEMPILPPVTDREQISYDDLMVTDGIRSSRERSSKSRQSSKSAHSRLGSKISDATDGFVDFSDFTPSSCSETDSGAEFSNLFGPRRKIQSSLQARLGLKVAPSETCTSQPASSGEKSSKIFEKKKIEDVLLKKKCQCAVASVFGKNEGEESVVTTMGSRKIESTENDDIIITVRSDKKARTKQNKNEKDEAKAALESRILSVLPSGSNVSVNPKRKLLIEDDVDSCAFNTAQLKKLKLACGKLSTSVEVTATSSEEQVALLLTPPTSATAPTDTEGIVVNVCTKGSAVADEDACCDMDWYWTPLSEISELSDKVVDNVAETETTVVEAQSNMSDHSGDLVNDENSPADCDSTYIGREICDCKVDKKLEEGPQLVAASDARIVAVIPAAMSDVNYSSVENVSLPTTVNTEVPLASVGAAEKQINVPKDESAAEKADTTSPLIQDKCFTEVPSRNIALSTLDLLSDEKLYTGDDGKTARDDAKKALDRKKDLEYDKLAEEKLLAISDGSSSLSLDSETEDRLIGLLSTDEEASSSTDPPASSGPLTQATSDSVMSKVSNINDVVLPSAALAPHTDRAGSVPSPLPQLPETKPCRVMLTRLAPRKSVKKVDSLSTSIPRIILHRLPKETIRRHMQRQETLSKMLFLSRKRKRLLEGRKRTVSKPGISSRKASPSANVVKTPVSRKKPIADRKQSRPPSPAPLPPDPQKGEIEEQRVLKFISNYKIPKKVLPSPSKSYVVEPLEQPSATVNFLPTKLWSLPETCPQSDDAQSVAHHLSPPVPILPGITPSLSPPVPIAPSEGQKDAFTAIAVSSQPSPPEILPQHVNAALVYPPSSSAGKPSPVSADPGPSPRQSPSPVPSGTFKFNFDLESKLKQNLAQEHVVSCCAEPLPDVRQSSVKDHQPTSDVESEESAPPVEPPSQTLTSQQKDSRSKEPQTDGVVAVAIGDNAGKLCDDEAAREVPPAQTDASAAVCPKACSIASSESTPAAPVVIAAAAGIPKADKVDVPPLTVTISKQENAPDGSSSAPVTSAQCAARHLRSLSTGATPAAVSAALASFVPKTEVKTQAPSGPWGAPCLGYEYISTDHEENADNFDRRWGSIRNLSSEVDLYRIIRQRWHNLIIPNPARNLTCRHRAYNRQMPRRNPIPEPRMRTQSCTEVYERQLANIQRESEVKIKFMEGRQNMQMQELIRKQNATLDIIRRQEFAHDSYYNQWHGRWPQPSNNEQLIRQQIDEIHHMRRFHSDQLSDLHRERDDGMHKIQKYIDEVRSFYGFYQTIDPDGRDKTMLTEGQVVLAEESDRMFNAFLSIYEHN